jgi:hypothetical protein
MVNGSSDCCKKRSMRADECSGPVPSNLAAPRTMSVQRAGYVSLSVSHSAHVSASGGAVPVRQEHDQARLAQPLGLTRRHKGVNRNLKKHQSACLLVSRGVHVVSHVPMRKDCCLGKTTVAYAPSRTDATTLCTTPEHRCAQDACTQETRTV